MSKKRTKFLAGVSLGLLAVALGASVSWAKSPAREVILESYSSPTPSGFWEGPAIMWIGEVKYDGWIFYAGEGRMNANGWHGTEIHVYDFGDLGTLEISGTAKTSFAYVSPDHRWHYYTSHLRVTGGTGAFSDAHGVFQFGGNTDWHVISPVLPFAFAGGQGVIVGIELNGP